MHSEYEPNLNEDYMNDSQLQYFKAKLLSMKQDYSSMSAVRLCVLGKSNQDVNVEDGFESSGLTDVDLLNEDNHVYMQKEIYDALTRINNKSYGYCEDTGKDIGIKRLMANPVARYSIEAQEIHDMEEKNMYKFYRNE